MAHPAKKIKAFKKKLKKLEADLAKLSKAISKDAKPKPAKKQRTGKPPKAIKASSKSDAPLAPTDA